MFTARRIISRRCVPRLHGMPIARATSGAANAGRSSALLGRVGAAIVERPVAYLTIPVVASGVGLVTNWMGVKMVFYPLEYTGVELYRSECSPFGLCRQLSMPWSLCPAMLCPPCCEKVLAQILLLRVPCLTVGWQGIVPARTEKMAKRLTMIVTSELMSLQEAFNGIDPGRFATLLTPTVLHAIRRDCEFGDWWAWALAPFL